MAEWREVLGRGMKELVEGFVGSSPLEELMGIGVGREMDDSKEEGRRQVMKIEEDRIGENSRVEKERGISEGAKSDERRGTEKREEGTRRGGSCKTWIEVFVSPISEIGRIGGTYEMMSHEEGGRESEGEEKACLEEGKEGGRRGCECAKGIEGGPWSSRERKVGRVGIPPEGGGKERDSRMADDVVMEENLCRKERRSRDSCKTHRPPLPFQECFLSSRDISRHPGRRSSRGGYRRGLRLHRGGRGRMRSRSREPCLALLLPLLKLSENSHHSGLHDIICKTIQIVSIIPHILDRDKLSQVPIKVWSSGVKGDN